MMNLLSFFLYIVHIAAFGSVLYARQTDELSAFIEKMSASRASIDYSFILDDGKVKIKGEGNVIVQDNAYLMTGNGLKIWCNGFTVWTADTVSNEVIIESIDGNQTVVGNPALLAGSLDKEFSWDGRGTAGTFNGKPAKVFLLTPRGDTGVKEGAVFFEKNGKTVAGAEIHLADGSKMTFTVSSIAFSEPGIISDFTPDCFPPDWIITDLRSDK